jgi:hypothetical protein
VTDPVKDAVDTIERVLDEVLSGENAGAAESTSSFRETDYARRS